MTEKFIDTAIVERGIQWDYLKASGVIDVNEMIMIKGFVQSPDTQTIALNAYGSDYCKILLKLLVNIKCVDYVRIVISLLDKYIGIISNVLLEFHPFETFSKFVELDNNNFFVKAKALDILGHLLYQTNNKNIISSNLDNLLRWTLRDLQKVQTLEDLDLLLSSLKPLLRFREARPLLMSLDGLQILEHFYEVPQDNIIYNSLYCVWLLSYHKDVVKSISNTSLQKIIQTIKNTRTHRIIRMGVGIIRNLADVNYRNRELIVESNLIKLFPQFVSLKYEDPEFRTNLEFLQKKIEQTIEHMTSWPVYKDRILSGAFKRSIIHKDDGVWKRIISNFGDNNFEVVGSLLEFIKRSPDSEKVAVALYHIKYFLKYHPASHRILGLIPHSKALLMIKLEDASPKVQLEALFAVQNLVLK
jgi:hypothetical protein